MTRSTEPDGRRFVELDNRRRAPLAKIARPGDTRFLAHREPDGTIVLVPAVVMPLTAVPEPPEGADSAQRDPTA